MEETLTTSIENDVSRRSLLARAAGVGLVGGALLAHTRPEVAWAADAPTPSLIFDVREYGAEGNGVANDTTDIQRAITAAAGVGVVYFPPGTYRAVGLRYVSDTTLRGASRGSVVIRLPDGVSGSVLQGPTNTRVQNLIIEDLTLDGNNVEPGNAHSLFHSYALDGLTCRHVTFRGSRGYGVGLQGYWAASGSSKRGEHRDLLFEACAFLDNGLNQAPVTTDADGIDIKQSERVTFLGCHAEGNSDKGFNVRGRFVTMIGCRAINNGSGFAMGTISSVTDTAGLAQDVSATASEITVTDGDFLPPSGEIVIDAERIRYERRTDNSLTQLTRSYGAASAASHVAGAGRVALADRDSYMELLGCSAENNSAGGIAIYCGADEADGYVSVVGCSARRNGGGGLGISPPGSSGRIYASVIGGHFHSNNLHGIAAQGAGSLTVQDSQCHRNGVDGVRLIAQDTARLTVDARNNGGVGVRLLAAGTDLCSDILTDGVVRGNVKGQLSGTGFRVTGHIPGVPAEVTIGDSVVALPLNRPTLEARGTARVNLLSASFERDVVTLVCAPDASFTLLPRSQTNPDRNMVLDEQFVAAPGRWITLHFTGGAWHELTRRTA